jgi:hypothetical protein
MSEITEHELEQLEKDARRPNRGSKYYPPSVVLALIEEVKMARGEKAQQGDLFATEEDKGEVEK